MKILLDPQIFSTQNFGGISRYFAELLFYTLNNKAMVSIKCPLPYHANFHLEEKKLLPVSRFSQFIYKQKFIGNAILKRHFINYKKDTIAHLKKQQFDVFVPTYFDPYFLKYLGSKPFVLTVYDMIHELFPQYFEANDPIAAYKKLLMEKATAIIAISKSTKNDILKIYPHIDASKIHVVYLSQSIDTTVRPLEISSLPKKYILFVGNRDDYKNFDFFINAVAPLLHADAALFVVCAGGGSFKKAELETHMHLGISNQVLQAKFSDAELYTYYANASMFVFPSLYEGFGIPVLEAMVCGCPVVLANHSSFPEVAGNAGVYFECRDKNDLTQKMSILLNDSEFKKDYIKAGYLQAQNFSWQKTANECLAIFESITTEKNGISN